MYLCKPVRKYIMILWRKEFEANDNAQDEAEDGDARDEGKKLLC